LAIRVVPGRGARAFAAAWKVGAQRSPADTIAQALTDFVTLGTQAPVLAEGSIGTTSRHTPGTAKPPDRESVL
jgi:hypothetical protein